MMETLSGKAWELISKSADLLILKDPRLSKPEAIKMFCGTPEGQACVEAYDIGLARERRPGRDVKLADALYREITKEAETLVAKSSSLSQQEAEQRVCKEKPQLYERYRKAASIDV
jgi:hypothetical protein